MGTNFYSQTGKRWFDATCALGGLVILAPFLFLVALMVRLTSPGPALFRQARTGQFGRPFRIFKFRTMRADAALSGSFLTAKGDPRITAIGKWMRKAKVDELPQLINVLVGDMSLVGPRPEVPVYTANYTERQRRVLCVKPGISGPSANAYIGEEELLARQVDKEAFYLATVLPAKLEIDLSYCEKIAFAEDLRLIWTTLMKVIRSVIAVRKALPQFRFKASRDS